MHSLLVTAGFTGRSGDKHSGRQNRVAASEGSYLSAEIYWASVIKQRKGGLISVFLANCPILVERNCSGYNSFHHEIPLPVM